MGIGSCNRYVSVEEEIERLKACPIDLCFNQMMYMQNINEEWSKDDSVSMYRPSSGLVVYFDSTICATCSVKTLYKWYDIMDKSRKNYNQDFKFYFIFSTSSDQIEDINYSLNSISFDYPIFLDTCNIFTKKNTNLPTNPLLHVFMIDKNRNVVMVGSPLNNERLENAYWRKLKHLTRNY